MSVAARTRSQSRLLIALGLLYTVIIAAGVFAHFTVRMKLLERISDIGFVDVFLARAQLIQWSFLADAAMVVADAAVGLLFLLLLKRVNATLSLLAAVARWIQSAILAYGIYFLTPLLHILDEVSSTGGTPETPGEVGGLLTDHAQLYILSGVFFGLSCMLLGYLFIRARFMPSYLGVFLGLAGLTYVADGAVNTLFPAYASLTETLVAVAALFAEIYLCVWLLFHGIRGLISGTPGKD